MNLGIVADTHDDLDAVAFGVDTFEQHDVDAVVHCGDFVAPFSAAPFEGPWDFHAVRGNNDGEWALADVVSGFGTYHGEFADLSLDGVDVAVYHGTSGAIVDALVDCGDYDYVLHGHTHERAREDRGDTTRLNPGGIPFADAPEAFSVALLDTATDEVAVAVMDDD